MEDSITKIGAMSGFEHHLRKSLHSNRIAIVGLGNTSRADDGFGIRVAELVRTEFPDRVFLENDGMERVLNDVNSRKDIEVVIFLDTVDAGKEPGTLLILSKESIRDAKSTHEIPLTFYLSLVEKPCFLFGIQPGELGFMSPVTGGVGEGIKKVTRILMKTMESSQ